MDKEIEKIIRAMQTSVYDQISGLKTDVQNSTKESQAALEICAELEQSVNLKAPDKEHIQRLSEAVYQICDLSAKEAELNALNDLKNRILCGISLVYSRTSFLNTIKLRVCSNDPKEMYICVQPMFKLQELVNNTIEKIDKSTTSQELKKIADDFFESFMTIQNELEKENVKYLDHDQ